VTLRLAVTAPVDVREVRDPDPADLVRPEGHGRVAVEGGTGRPTPSVVTPCGDQELEHGDRRTPDAVVALDRDVVLLLLGALLDARDGDRARDSPEEVFVVELVRLLLDRDLHSVSSTVSKSIRSVAGSPTTACS
jgi:hypothetical protein